MKRNENTPVALVRGVGDVGSAIAWMLFQAGFAVISHEDRQPRTIRRKMAFCDALWEGEAQLAGIATIRIDPLENVLSVAKVRKSISLYAGPFDDLVDAVIPDLIVDGRIQKFANIMPLKGKAAYTIGIGPRFIAGEHVDAVVESCWGDDIGRVILQGSAVDPIPVPPRLNGIGWERFVRSDTAGRFETKKEIGEYVTAGMKIGQIGGRYVIAPISGHIRGLLYPGLSVLKGEKICEIDPRGDEAHFEGLAERPRFIASGVLRALDSFFPQETGRVPVWP